MVASILRHPLAPVVAFFALAMLYAASLGGLQYDEALGVLGAVQMMRSREELPLPRDPHTWLCGLGRCWPLMTMTYVGALREYLSLPVLAVFGTGPVAVRLSGIVCAAFGVWGVARLSVAAAWISAVSAALLPQIAFDQGCMTVWIGCFGLTCFGAATGRPFLVGLGAGLGVWARANFLWLAVSGVAGFAPLLWRHARRDRGAAVKALLGALLGVFPFVLYQLVSGFLTFRSIESFRVEGAWTDLLVQRVLAFASGLANSAENRALWDGPPPQVWQSALFAAVLLGCLAVCIARGDAWKRGLALTSIIMLGFLLTSRLPVAEHHLSPLIPLFALVVAAAAELIPYRQLWLALGLVFAAAGMYWNAVSIDGLRRTGGLGAWSDGIIAVQRRLEQHASGRETRILDWGFQNSLFVLTRGQLRTREELDDSTVEGWRNRIAAGGLFLAHPLHQAYIPGPYLAFRQALAESGREPTRTVFREKRGRVLAELWEAPAGSAAAPPPGPFGLHEADEQGWQWTKGEFGVWVDGPASALSMRVHVPQAVLDRTGPLVLTAVVGTTRLEDEHYWASGIFEYSRPVRVEGRTQVRFSLDKFLAAGEVEGRELGLMVKDLVVR